VHASYTELLSDAPCFIVDMSLAEQLNSREGTSWSPLFFVGLAVALNGLRLEHVHWTALFGRSDWTTSLDHQYPFAVDVELVAPLQQAAKDFAERYEQKRKKGEQHRLLADFVSTEPRIHDRLSTVLQGLIKRCYPDVIVDGDFVMLPPNSYRKHDDILEEVLAHLNGPSHVDRILEAWHELFPDKQTTVEAIRSTANRNKLLFFSIGRTSTYGLRRWEEERKDLRGGTIRTIVEAQLEASPMPIHIEDLVEEVRKFRPNTHLNSVRYNLQLEATGRFTFFPGGFLGLSSRTYSSIPDPPALVPGSLMRSSILERFKGEHRNVFAEYLKAHCNATAQRIDRVIDKAVADGRLLIDLAGIIQGTTATGSDAGDWHEELPFEW
jgi:hypothetical protein